MHKLTVAFTVLLFASCSKKQPAQVLAETKIAVYRLASHQVMANQCRVDPATAVLEATPLIEEGDIIHYDSVACVYTLSDQAAQKIIALQPRTALAFTVNKEAVFYFVAMPPFTNSECRESIVTSMMMGTTMPVRLGYPPYPEPNIPDQRNDKRLMDALKAKGKL